MKRSGRDTSSPYWWRRVLAGFGGWGRRFLLGVSGKQKNDESARHDAYGASMPYAFLSGKHHFTTLPNSLGSKVTFLVLVLSLLS